MANINTDIIKNAFNSLKDSLFKTFDQTPNAVKIIMEKNGRKKTIDFSQIFETAGLTQIPGYSAVTSPPTANKKPKKKASDVDDLTDTGVKVKSEEVDDVIPTTTQFNLTDVYDKQLMAIRYYEPTATTQRLSVCMDFLPADIASDPKLAKSTRPTLMVITFNLPNRTRRKS